LQAKIDEILTHSIVFKVTILGGANLDVPLDIEVKCPTNDIKSPYKQPVISLWQDINTLGEWVLGNYTQGFCDVQNYILDNDEKIETPFKKAKGIIGF
jgi:hypothetical protein